MVIYLDHYLFPLYGKILHSSHLSSPRGIWALIQATISQIDFDYASYAEVRLGEYWAWRREQESAKSASFEEEKPLRERRWAQEA